MTASCGFVYLVGGGPGDPGLITVRGLSLLHKADVVVHDRLAPTELLADLDPSTEIINVGKSTGDHRSQQVEIGRILIDRAKRGLCVVRLKGGDPFVFGRGYEEMQICRESGIPCVVIPGVSSAFAAPAVVGIPITSRKLVRSFAVVTARVAEESEAPEPNYEALAKLDTIVVLMGCSRLGAVANAFRAAGLDGSTPVACIENATMPQQRVVVATLATISDAATEAGLAPPVTTVIGKVAAMGDVPGTLVGLGLAESGLGESSLSVSPMAAKRVLVTRPPDRSRHLMELLRAKGAIPISCPLTETVFPDQMPELDDAISKLSQYEWIAITSVNGVRGFWKRIRRMGLDARAIGSCKVAAVDATTADSLQGIGIAADVVGAGHGAAGLAKQIIEAVPDAESAAGGRSPARVLFPCSDRARPTLSDALTKGGMAVESAIAYRTVALDKPAPPENATREGVDVIVFYSPSSVEAFVGSGMVAGAAAIACIGKTTATAVRTAGLTPTILSERPSDDGMVEAISKHFRDSTV